MIQIIEQEQKKLKQLIQNLSQLQKQISHPHEAKKNNIRNSLIIKIPKYLLITKILPYLSIRQCLYLSSTSIILRRTIYSPIGWGILNKIQTPYQIIVLDSNLMKKPYLKKQMSFSQAEDHLQDYEDEKFLIKQRAKYKEMLWSKYKSHLSLKQKNQVLTQKVRIQRMYLFRKKLQKIQIQRQRQDLEEQNTRFKQKLKKLTSQFIYRQQKLSKKIEQIQKQNQKLKKQKQALVIKIKQYQQEIPKITQKAEQSKKNLIFLKQSIEKINLQPIPDIQ